MKNCDSSSLTKNSRVGVRRRDLDINKQLTIVRTRDELKRFE